MIFDGKEIELEEKLAKCFIVEEKLLFITDKKGDIKLTFNLSNQGRNVDEEIKKLAQTHIFNYDDIIRVANKKTIEL